ncbi:MAG: hypothetical protein H3C30_06565 [Candidatus Hydrogenedentes bacterium]|nr:hypothetical protein [Candidatus Hydrogenedentota bacterium]
MRNVAGIFAVVAALGAWGADDSWKLPLEQKEQALEQNARERHNILGLYPSQVEIWPDSGQPNYTTRGHCDIAHAVCWSANYLAGCSYRYAFLKRSGAPAEVLADAKRRADEVFEAIYRCQLVTGVRGLQARGYAIGRGESYEERIAENPDNIWYQGAGEYANLRWRGSPSHHNYSDSVHGLCQYYDLAAEGAQKDRCREAIDALVGYWVDNDFNIWHIGHEQKTPILGFTDGKTLNMRIMMAIAGAKAALHATGDLKYQAAYDRLINQYGVRGLKPFTTEKDFDDAEHVFCHLENLFRIETDPELLAAYRVVLDALWANHKDDAQSLFTYIRMAAAPDTADREKALGEALFSLQSWPTDTTLQPRMSSLKPELKPPYPLYAAAWDNEYIWKGNLLRGDGWLSRIITEVSVPAEDPLVIYALDQNGDIYQSRDGAETAGGWFPVSLTLPSPARRISAGPRVRMIGAVCDDGAYVSLHGGNRWIRLAPPEEAGRPLEVRCDPELPNAILVTGEKGAYRTVYRRTRDIGLRWEKVAKGGAGPAGEKPAIAANAAGSFKPDSGGVLKSADGGNTWELKTKGLDIAQARTVFAPSNTDWVFAGTPAGLYLSKDGGETWEDGHLVLQFTYNSRREIGGAAFIDAYWRGRYYGFIDDAAAVAHWKE